MLGLFLQQININAMSILAFVLIVVFRFIIRNRSKKYVLSLWKTYFLLLFIPICFPIKINRNLTLLPLAQYQISNSTLNSNIQLNFLTISENVSVNFITILFIIGLSLIYIVFFIKELIIKDRIKFSVLENDVYFIDYIKTPFLYGNNIYIPSTSINKDNRMIIAHENIHKKYKHFYQKRFALLVCLLNWYNLIVWIAYMLMDNDFEMFTDERTIEKNNYSTKEYCDYLLEFIRKSRRFNKYIVSFSGGLIHKRIIHLIKYKKTKIYFSSILVLIIAFLLVFPLSDYSNDDFKILKETFDISIDDIYQYKFKGSHYQSNIHNINVSYSYNYPSCLIASIDDRNYLINKTELVKKYIQNAETNEPINIYKFIDDHFVFQSTLTDSKQIAYLLSNCIYNIDRFEEIKVNETIEQKMPYFLKIEATNTCLYLINNGKDWFVKNEKADYFKIDESFINGIMQISLQYVDILVDTV